MRNILLISCIFFLTACCLLEDDYNPASAPTTTSYTIVGDSFMNLNLNNEPTSVEIKVFELTDDSMFLSANFDQLTGDFKDALKSNYIDDYDYVVFPDQFKFIESSELNEKTRYIGVAAKYSNPNEVSWKKIIKVEPVGHKYHILMILKHADVLLGRVE